MSSEFCHRILLFYCVLGMTSGGPQKLNYQIS